MATQPSCGLRTMPQNGERGTVHTSALVAGVYRKKGIIYIRCDAVMEELYVSIC